MGSQTSKPEEQSPTMANTEEKTPAATTTAALDDDEPDEW